MHLNTKGEFAELIGTMKCAKDFACVEAGFDTVCEARDIGMEHNLLCMDKRACQECGFGVTTGPAHLCRCPLRIYAAKSLGK